VEAGVTDNELPLPSGAPLQLPLYHFQVAPVPKLPPVLVRVVLWPLQIVVALALAEVTGVDVSLTVKVKLLQAVVLHVPSART
jgi:hypothetical protein